METMNNLDLPPGPLVPFVRVDWEDIKFEDNWNEEVGEFNTSSATLWGHLIELTSTKVVIAHGYSWESEKWVTVHTLPRGACTIVGIEIRETGEMVLAAISEDEWLAPVKGGE